VCCGPPKKNPGYAPGEDDPSHYINDIVKDIFERETLALAAPSMTMEDIFRATTSSSINHHAVFVFEFENVQMELKQLAEAEDDGAGAAGQTGKVLC
jgi:hypothetical protein